MDRQFTEFDWNQAKAFLATADGGSLSAAARALDLTQPTVGRQITALEEELGVALFDRAGRSLVLTESGIELLEHVRSMADAANQVSLAASGRSHSIAGQVCITASDGMTSYLLPTILPTIRKLAPQIEIELLASNSIQDLRRREADIAIRHVEPTEPNLIAKPVRSIEVFLYAASDYLDRKGRPESLQDLGDMDFIGFENPNRMIAYLQALGIPVVRDNMKLISNSGIACWEMAKNGLGITLMTRDLAEQTSDMERLFPDQVRVQVPTWLTTHRELRTSRRIRLVFDVLADALS